MEKFHAELKEHLLNPILRYLMEYLAPYMLIIVFILLSQSILLLYLVLGRTLS